LGADLTVASPLISRALIDQGAPHITTVTLHPLGLAGPDDVPPGAADGTALTRIQPDTFLGDPQAADGILLDDGAREWSLQDCLDLVGQYPPGQRLALSTGDDAAHWLIPPWYPLLSEGSVVMYEPGVNLQAEKIDQELG